MKNSTALGIATCLLVFSSLFIEGPTGTDLVEGAFFCLLAGVICHAIEIK
tara:strand:+ start:789 stop:938 length:150 start_codon:yes stop_codon:yes gene_type:complete